LVLVSFLLSFLLSSLSNVNLTNERDDDDNEYSSNVYSKSPDAPIDIPGSISSKNSRRLQATYFKHDTQFR
jgi:hypothetical protein